MKRNFYLVLTINRSRGRNNYSTSFKLSFNVTLNGNIVTGWYFIHLTFILLDNISFLTI